MTPATLHFSWEGGPWEWGLVAAAVLVLAGWWPRLRGLPRAVAALRVGALGLLALAAAKPAVTLYGLRSERPRVALLLDASRGMAASRQGLTDFARARAGLAALRGRLEALAEVSVYALGARGVRVDWEGLEPVRPGGPLDLARGLEDVWREHGETLSAAWLFSNGVGDRSQDLSAAVARLGCPVYAVGMGSRKGGEPFRLDSVRAPEFSFLHLPFPVEVHWTARGLGGGSARLRVLHEGRELASGRVEVAKDFETGTSTLAVVSPALGSQAFTVEASPLRGPAFPRRAREFAQETVRQKLRILYLAGHPSFEYAALRQFLKSNPNFELVSFVILRNPENVVPAPESELSLIPFPAQEIFLTTLQQFDLFLLEDFSYGRFQLPVAYLNTVRQFVERGGGLMLIGGDTGFAASGLRGSPLEALLPVEVEADGADWSPGAFTAVAVNAGHPLLNLEGEAAASARAWAGLPPLDGFNRVRGLRAGAEALLVHPQARLPDGAPMPVLAARALGRGRVLALGSPSTWRWKLGAGADPRLAAFYEAFWQRNIQYLTGSLDLSKVRLAPPAADPVAGEPFPVAVNVLDETFSPLSDPNLTLELRARGRDAEKVYETREIRPGVFSGDVPGLPAGPWRIAAEARYRGRPWGADARTVTVREAGAGPRFDRLFLEELARRSRGRYCDWEGFSASQWLEALPQKREEKSVRVHVPLWASGELLGLLLGLLLLEWLLRRRAGYW